MKLDGASNQMKCQKELGILFMNMVKNRHKLKLLILSRLNDFMTCSVRFNIQSEGPISKL